MNDELLPMDDTEELAGDTLTEEDDDLEDDDEEDGLGEEDLI